MKALPRTLVATLLTLGALAPLSAADDVRLTFTYGLEDLRFKPPGADASRVKDGWDSSRRYEAGIWSVNNGAAFGLSALRHEANYSNSQFELDLEGWGGRLYFGIASPLSTAVSFDVHAFFGYSRLEAKVERGLQRWSDSSAFIEYGALGQFTTVLGASGGGLLLGVGGGYLFGDGSFKMDGKRSLKHQGFVLTGTVGWRF
ncbi:MAG: hypothetical protein EA402_10545 [Planctomycetota bacterium]|nr:MAG: hypothetical protein EA402_10545 [Planctomycetota bacterium]